MKILFLFLSILSLGCKSTAVSPTDKAYPVGVSFNSICCGPPSDEFLKTFVKDFNRLHKIKLSADIIAGCGREGEFVVLFNIQKLKPAMRTKFITALEKQVTLQDSKNKKENSSSGGVHVIKDAKQSGYSHCRISPQNWAYEK